MDNLKLHESAVPFVVTYRKILEKPKAKITTKRLGFRQIVKNIVLKAFEFYEDVAIERITEVESPGRSVAVHWAFQVEDPWDVSPGREANLVGCRMLDDVPPSGAHFEIISPERKVEEHISPPISQHANGVVRLQDDPRSYNSRRPFVRPPAEQYVARHVAPIVLDDGPPEEPVPSEDLYVIEDDEV